MGPSPPYVTAFFNKIYLMLWKNWIHLKRQYIITTCEIILPTLFVLMFAYGNYKVQREAIDSLKKYERDTGSAFRYGSYGPPEYYDEEWAKKGLVDKLKTWNCDENVDAGTAIIGYMSKNAKALNILENMVEDAFNSLSNTKKVKYKKLNSEDEMETFYSVLQSPKQKNNDFRRRSFFDQTTGPCIKYKFAFGIVFEELTNKTATYKIRLPDFTADLLASGGPNSDNEYFRTSFTRIQLLLDKALIHHFTGKEPQFRTSFQEFPGKYGQFDRKLQLGRTSGFDLERQEYQYFEKASAMTERISLAISFGFLFIVPTVVRGVVSEKQTGIKELMKMSGLPEWLHWLGWMLNLLIIFGITVTLITFLLFVRFNSDTLAVLEHSHSTLFWVILMVYAVSAITYCFALSAFFERPTLATTVGLLIWMASYFGLGFWVDTLYGGEKSLGVILTLCLFPNVGMHFTVKAVAWLDVIGKGAKWGNMHHTYKRDDEMTLLYPLLMMLASSFLNMAVCLYFEAVLPKKYGARKPFYFIFLPSEWGFSRRSAVNRVGQGELIPNTERPGFESEPAGIETGVRIVNLRKTFGKRKIAVNDVSMNIMKGQIFCLLGENGAGKTTIMSILTGLFLPTSGTAFINGWNIKTDMAKIRQSLGLCPQHNMLFDKMTVFEHLKFFGMLKGLSKINAKAEALYLLQVLRFPEKQDVFAKDLSGGQKRKLSLGCSLVGGSKIVFLDEPTSGMDPEARRAIWDILLSIRHDRTIVLTTHHLEEADVLGDRIAIMSLGKLQCCGSQSYLKRFYGGGYILSMTIAVGADQEKILNTVRNHIADAYFKESYSNNEAQLSVVLPSQNNMCSSFPALFSALTQKQKDLGIDEIGVGWTTMDDVFVRVEEISHGQPVDGHDKMDNQNSIESDTKPVKVGGFKLLVSQFHGLLMKDIVYTIRKKGLFIFQMLIVVLFTYCAVKICKYLFSTWASEPTTATTTRSILISLTSYNDPITLYSSIDQGIGKDYAAIVGSSAKPISSTFNNNVTEALLDVAKTDEASYRERYIIAGEIKGTNMKAMFSTVAQHSAPLSMNMMTNTMLRQAVGAEYKINIINHPLRNTKIEELLPPLQQEQDPRRLEEELLLSFAFGVLVCTSFALLIACFIIPPTEERLCKANQLQLMTGVSPILYWGSKLICDFFVILIAICLMTACLVIFESNNAFTRNGGAGALFLIMAVYGVAALSFTYLLSTFVRSPAGGFTLIIIFHILAGILIASIAVALEAIPESFVGNAAVVPNFIGRFFPSFGATKGAMQYVYISASKSKCYGLGLTDEANKLREAICSSDFYPYTSAGMNRECCDNCGKLGNDEEHCVPNDFFKWTGKLVYKYRFQDWAQQSIPGIGQELTWLLVFAVLYFGILLMREYRVCKPNAQENAAFFRRTVTDADVVEENNRVNELVAQGRTNENSIVLDNLCKSYETFLAVNLLSFGVYHGECFGLLGVNGAGKTTTFRMLTGDETRSFGNSYVQNLSLSKHRKKFFANFGYCPQFDAFIGGLTGVEMLSLFARLRGVPFRSVKKETDKWLRKTGLTESGKVKCANYSGGMKRRLSAAMALIGDPQIILMDEPTSGVDPVARRQFWKIITCVKNSGQSIILTSHSMEECEALCSRLGIMVNGELQCLGGVQHLKSKFAQGYSLTIKLKQENYQNTEMTAKISNDVLSIFNPCSLKDHHQTTMKFQIHSQERSWEDLYKTMEGIKENNQECIEEYAITETTLEEVFLSFARAQQLTISERVIKGAQSRMHS